ncbi:[protein-PII] uridylyltransferase [Rariglobus hedericola]|uniref:Bifunctional uridylyltransferase/uridylyl-removing enzyme n=1 Tax=Rariglobus hedericola TaxID=2597822 RepID=A0A556QR59_9BACT|nr:[protein-PII] uridylyltransferase [Rariglobus hedericola]TSJ79112.1 [protein-PII] uridylyltransferase [Rariglobus hedericola]
MIGRIQKHARERLNFVGEVPTAKRLLACKTFLRLESAMIRMRHDAGESGLAITRARSAMIDVMLSHLFNYAIASWERKNGHLYTPVALLALGGYGRCELSPLSDIDIMFLFPSKMKEAAIKPLQEHLTNEILYILWDCGLKVGHSTRTIDEVFIEARKDIQNKTALLEARLIAGSESLFDGFAHTYKAYYTVEDPKAYISARLEDQKNRRNKHGDSVFLQEPDIKNGVGGLRDYQNTLWMARVKLGISEIKELGAQNYLRHNELRDFQRAYEFLHRVRNELHLQKKRPTDVLDLEAQPRIALGLGYTNRDMLGRVEQFMRDYYRAAQTIYRISKLVENRLALTLEKPSRFLSFREVVRSRRHERVKRIDGFVLRNRELSSETPNVFREDPARLIRVFRHCQSLDAQMDFALQTLVRECLPLITRRVSESIDANTSFKAILDEAGNVHPTLALMHELGVLGRFIPEFDGLTCLVQHEYYHRYTADIHTLNAIRELDNIFTQAEPITLKYREALHETPEPTLLYLILLLHDIGKAKGIQGHAESGVVIAQPILKRLNVSPENSELVIFVIKNHLIMARFWQKRDVDDPNTAAAFAEMVMDADKLRHLYVHTFCDARGTAAGLWNGYKDALHTSLFRATLDQLIHGAALVTHNSQRLQMTYQDLVSKTIPGISQDEITAHFNLLPERYFIHTDPAEISLHISMVNRLLKSITQADSVGTLRPVIEWKDDLNRSLTVVNVVTWDRAGLFYKLAGAFSVAGLSILGAKVISRSDHIAIDTFYVVEPGRGIVQSTKAQEIFARTVEEALVTNKDLYPDIVAQARKHAPPRYTQPSGGEILHASFPPTVEVYHELSMQRTIVEVQARDEIGLLFRLAKTISDHGFDITFARIGTERGIAIDTFYIENAAPESTEENARLHVLRDALSAIITPADNAAAAAI